MHSRNSEADSVFQVACHVKNAVGICTTNLVQWKFSFNSLDLHQMWASLVCDATDDCDLEHVAMLSSVPSQEITKAKTDCKLDARTLLGKLKREEVATNTIEQNVVCTCF